MEQPINHWEKSAAESELIDVTEQAKKAGFKNSCSITKAAYKAIISSTQKCSEDQKIFESLLVLRLLIETSKANGTNIFFPISKNKKLKALCHPGGCHEPVITISTPDEFQR